MSDDERLMTQEERERALAILHTFRNDIPQITISIDQEQAHEIEQLRAQLDQPPAGAPDRGADVDALLDWRAKEKRLGHRYTLEQIAKWYGFSLSKLKRKSSERKPRGTQKRPPKSGKKFGS
jgi:hypothetical protein